MTDRLVIDLDAAGVPWSMGDDALEDLRWYLEDYLTAPFGVYEDRGARVEAQLADWGRAAYGTVFGSASMRRGAKLVLRSAAPGLLALPWELMVAPGRATPLAMDLAGLSRSLSMADDAETLAVPGRRLRVLMVISRPSGARDVGYRMIARPLLERLGAARDAVDLVVLRPPTLDALRAELRAAAAAGIPYQIVHFDGHGMMLAGEGMLVFEGADGDACYISAGDIAKTLGNAGIPVAVLNACQSGAVGKDLEAAVATALLRAGIASVVAMAYTLYAVAAAEFTGAFYERLLDGGTISSAVSAGRRQLYRAPGRPSPKGDLPLADWFVPVHYMSREVSFPQVAPPRQASPPASGQRAESVQPAGDPVIGGLDAADGVFVGRDALFYQLEAAARLQKVIILSGPGGNGKTELAKAFGRWWRDTGGTGQPDWVFWHSFEPGVASFGLDRVVAEIGSALRGPQFELLDRQAQRELVEEALTRNRILLLWDNFEAVRDMPQPGQATPPLDDAGCEEVRNFLAHLAAHGNSVVLITSRSCEDWLGPASRIRVGVLARSEAIAYADTLLAPCPAAQQRREERSFGELLEWLNGHPLAMRLTLPRLAHTGPADVLAGLRGAGHVRDPSDAEQSWLSSLEMCVAYTFACLPEHARRLLPAVSLLNVTADAAVLAAISVGDTTPARFAGTSKQQWLEVLSDAARAGLLASLGSGVYRIHPALPGHLAAQWRAEDPGRYEHERQASEEALRAACASFSQWLREQIGSGDPALGYTMTGLHRQTLGAVLGDALEHEAWGEAESIVKTLNRYWVNRGLPGEADAWAARILRALTRHGQDLPEPARSLWLETSIEQAKRKHVAGQHAQARETLQEILEYVQDQRQTGRTRGRTAFIFHLLGSIDQDAGRFDEAEDWYRQSLAIKEELDDRDGMAGTYHHLGIIAQEGSRLAEAEAWYRQSLAIAEELGNRPHMSLTYHQLGNIAVLRGRLNEAEQWYRQSLAIKARFSDRAGMAGTYAALGITALKDGRLDEAEEWHRQALIGKEAGGNNPEVALTYHYLGIIAFRRGRLDEAEDWYRRSLAINVESGNLSRASMNYGQLGLLAEKLQQPEQALEWTIRCVEPFTSPFPHPATGPGPSHLTRLSRELGMPALERTWQAVTGKSVPQQVRDYIANHRPPEPGRQS